MSGRKKLKTQNFQKLNTKYKSGIILFLIGSFGLLFRIFYLPTDIPIVLDGLQYFTFAQEIKILGTIPNQIQFANIGWPIFLSSIFSIVQLNDALSYMQLQRISTIIISTITIIPLYFLINRFFDRKYCFLGIIIFIFEPRIIQNSILGITDSLYILILTSIFALFFSNNKNMIMISFALSALATYVRSEGVFIFITLAILYFTQIKNEKNKILKLIFMGIIFVLILSPIIPWRFEIFYDEFLVNEVEIIQNEIIQNEIIYKNSFVIGLENFSKFFVWAMIPSFIIFVPPGIIIALKRWNKETQSFIIPIIILSIPIFYAYSIPALDTRYLFILFPFFCLLTLVFVKNIYEKNHVGGKIFIVIIIGILISSVILLEYKKMDQEHEIIAFNTSEIIIESPKIVNMFYPESSYIAAAEIIEKWPDIPERDTKGNYKINTKILSVDTNYKMTEFFNMIEEKGVTHLVIDNKKDRADIYKTIFENGEKYEFLTKEYDSEKSKDDYRVKIFRINFEKIEN